MNKNSSDEEFQLECFNAVNLIKEFFKEKNIPKEVAAPAMLCFAIGHLAIDRINRKEFDIYISKIIDGIYKTLANEDSNKPSHFNLQ